MSISPNGCAPPTISRSGFNVFVDRWQLLRSSNVGAVQVTFGNDPSAGIIGGHDLINGVTLATLALYPLELETPQYGDEIILALSMAQTSSVTAHLGADK